MREIREMTRTSTVNVYMRGERESKERERERREREGDNIERKS